MAAWQFCAPPRFAFRKYSFRQDFWAHRKSIPYEFKMCSTIEHIQFNLWISDSDELTNLRVLCSICNEGAQNISPKRPEWVDLLVQIRRAPALDQVEALKWLIKKFPAQARANLPDSGK